MDSSSSSPGSQPNAERPNVHNMTFHEIIARYKERYERTIYFYIKATHDDGSVTEITNLPMVARLNGQIIDFNTLDLQSVQIDERHLVEKKDSEGHHTVITKDSRLEDMGTYFSEVTQGEETTLECTVVGKPGPEVVWKKDGVPVNVDQSCVNSNKDRKSHHTVVIKNVTSYAIKNGPLLLQGC
ncbi:hypothetical protein QR680_019088 [Steinernema hermaphroditum]|uniref:Ig-like domain-containing protein n=1 Tax=Steinernema hermaphroditum TaxID=289476 RepID=A0AA39HJW0_9BILA|nr:hypothetical protein QR680_019088 [Steinernema hermaphroditum]